MRRMRTGVLVAWLVAGGAWLLAGEEVVETYEDGAVRARYEVDSAGRKDGKYAEFWPDGTAKAEGKYRDDLRVGSWKEFHEGGQVRVECRYVAGELDGAYVEYRADGSVLKKGRYKAGEVQGELTWYDEAGKKTAPPREELAKAAHTPDRFPKSQAAIRKVLADLKVVSKEPEYVERPTIKAPYEAGELTDAYLEQGLRRAKAYRYLADVPWEIELDPGYCGLAQHGAVLLNALGQSTHTPERPGDMDEPFYKKAYEGCLRSNIHAWVKSLPAAVDSFMSDSDPTNIDAVGHRRWVLCPDQGKIGFGQSDTYVNMYVSEHSGKAPKKWEFTPWPPRGWCPREYFRAGDAWSVTLNPARYERPGRDLKVEVVPLDDLLRPAGDPLELDHFSVPDTDYGGGPAFVFLPAGADVAKGRYQVTVRNLRTAKDRDPAEIGWTVEFFPLAE